MAKLGVAIFKSSSCPKHGCETKSPIDLFNIGKYILKIYSNQIDKK